MFIASALEVRSNERSKINYVEDVVRILIKIHSNWSYVDIL